MERAIQASVLNRFGDMRSRDRGAAFEVGNGARDFLYTCVSARAEAELVHGALEKALGAGARKGDRLPFSRASCFKSRDFNGLRVEKVACPLFWGGAVNAEYVAACP